MRTSSASHSIVCAAALAFCTASPAAAQFATPFALANNAASMGAVASPATAPDSLALWDTANQFSYAARTGGVWSAPTHIANAFSGAPCCTVLRTDAGGNATFVFSTGSAGTYSADFSAGSWSTVTAVPPSPPSFQNGFTNFVMNANGDAAVIGLGQDLRVSRRAGGTSNWGAAETVPTPALPPDTVAMMDNAAISPGGYLIVTFHVALTGCTKKCGLALYAASESAPGAGWTLYKRLSPKATGTFMASQPFMDAQGHVAVAYVEQVGANLVLNTIYQRAPGGGWKTPVTLMTVPAKQGKKHASLSLIGAEADASGHATVIAGSGFIGVKGVNVLGIDGNIVSHAWNEPATLAASVAQNGVQYASNSAGGIALAWDNPDAPVSVLARTTAAGAWGTIQPVGSPSCATSTTICTQVLSLSLDGGGVQRILYNDNSTAPGTVYFSNSF